ncbi:MAG: hypothetical protein Q8O05_08110 [Chloroflexota bacterium]|nr:hypothetical protein [Chloroflexota bacterium]
MVSTIFSDRIVNATDLRKNQKKWLEYASRAPITIHYGDTNLTVMNRREAERLYAQIDMLHKIITFCEDYEKGRYSVFPWASYLSEEERQEFRKQLLNTALADLVQGELSKLNNLIEDWEATAETAHNSEATKSLLEKDNPKDYVTID